MPQALGEVAVLEDAVHAYLKLNPKVSSLTLSVRMRGTNLKPGKEGWHDARVALSFEGVAAGYPPRVPELRADSDWVAASASCRSWPSRRRRTAASMSWPMPVPRPNRSG